MMDFASLSSEQQEAALDGPALQPPDKSIVPNFDNPDNDNGLGYAIVTLCLVLGTLAFLIRTYTRIFRLKKLEIEDYLGLIAFGNFVAFACLMYRLLDSIGFFVHQWDIRLRDLSEVLYVLYVGSVVYGICIMFVKAAILLEWTRIFVPMGARNAFHRTCLALILVNTFFYVAYIFAQNLYCIPRQRIWDVTIQGNCIDKTALIISSSTINFISDIIILILPQRVIWTLQMSRLKKIGISFLFTIGLLACAAAGARLGAAIRYYDSADGVYQIGGSGMAALSEQTCGILVFCVPSASKAYRGSLVARKLSSLFRLSSSRGTAPSSAKRSQSRLAAHAYREIDGSGGSGSVRLSKLQALKTTSDSTEERPEAPQPQPPRKTRILRTTHFATKEHYIPGGGDVAKEQYLQQHPWVNEG
ncbi:hypothetical protein F4779DRAFT_597431 [Xylariaceae sp. FL0662B]|nr:hypothetical protein F4779DRAFT_597431 [Xylariaceae sp. FL0662B]